MKELLIIDGSSLLTTQFYGSKELKTSKGVYTNAVVGFFKVLNKILKNQRPSHLAVTWDISRNTFRREIYPEYKRNRKESPLELKEQFKLCQLMLDKMEIPQFMSATYEADDFTGTLVKKFESTIPIKLYTKDHDYIQLVSKNTNLWLVLPSKKKALEVFEEMGINPKKANLPDKVFEFNQILIKKYFGIEPIQIIDLKGLTGDSADNIPGIKGLGDTSAIPLLKKYNDIETLYSSIENLNEEEINYLKNDWKEKLGIKRPPINILLKKDNGKLINKDIALMSKKLATIKTDIPLNVTLDDLRLCVNRERGNKILKEYEINSITL